MLYSIRILRPMNLLLLLPFFFYLTLNAQTSTIAVDEFEKKCFDNNNQLLDVRTAEEFNSGHLKNALQADWNNDAEFKERVKSIDKNRPVYIYCLSGGRSAKAMQWLYDNGYKTVYNMQGGINMWKQSGKFVQGKTEVKQMSMAEYQTMIPKNKTVLVDIGAEWCPPCKKMKPIVESLEKENYTVVKIDGGAQTELCKTLKVEAFPVFIVYKNGVEKFRKQGLMTKEEIKKWMD